MTKIIEIEYCKKCLYNSEFTNEISYCHHAKSPQLHGGYTSIPNYPLIPSWCPLPDKEVRKRDAVNDYHEELTGEKW